MHQVGHTTITPGPPDTSTQQGGRRHLHPAILAPLLPQRGAPGSEAIAAVTHQRQPRAAHALVPLLVVLLLLQRPLHVLLGAVAQPAPSSKPRGGQQLCRGQGGGGGGGLRATRRGGGRPTEARGWGGGGDAGDGVYHIEAFTW